MAKSTNKSAKSGKQKTTVQDKRASTDNDCPIWMFDKLDKSGKFAFDVNRADFVHKEVLEKAIEYSNMTWAEIKRQTHDDGKSKHHMISYDKLSKEAQDRLRIKHLEEESDQIFSFSLRNLLRIVGIRRGRIFHVLWYDPNHEVCPSKLKHT